jgi:hypothetical protein
VCKVFQRKDLRPDFPVKACGLKAKARLLAGPVFSIYFYFNERGLTKMPHCVEMFLSGKPFFLCCFRGWIWKFGGFGVLTCDFWAENVLHTFEPTLPKRAKDGAP